VSREHAIDGGQGEAQRHEPIDDRRQPALLQMTEHALAHVEQPLRLARKQIVQKIRRNYAAARTLVLDPNRTSILSQRQASTFLHRKENNICSRTTLLLRRASSKRALTAAKSASTDANDGLRSGNNTRSAPEHNAPIILFVGNNI
jgi:hypothetical protein